MRRALVVIAAAFAAAPASAQDLPTPLAYALVATPHVRGSSDLTVTIRCGAHRVSMLERVRTRAAASIAAVIRAERARIARGAYGFRTTYDSCTAAQVNAPLKHVARVLRAKGIA
jgi:hypothetical protein